MVIIQSPSSLTSSNIGHAPYYDSHNDQAHVALQRLQQHSCVSRRAWDGFAMRYPLWMIYPPGAIASISHIQIRITVFSTYPHVELHIVETLRYGFLFLAKFALFCHCTFDHWHCWSHSPIESSRWQSRLTLYHISERVEPHQGRAMYHVLDMGRKHGF